MRFSFELKKKIGKGNLTIGSWITIGHPSVAEIMANAGFDWLTVDLEHSSITLSEAQDLIQVIESCGVTPLVRVGENRPSVIKRVMDAGATGVIVPMVNSKEDAINAVRAFPQNLNVEPLAIQSCCKKIPSRAQEAECLFQQDSWFIEMF